MADIPYGTYTVTLKKSGNSSWAGGALVYNAQGTTYKGQSVTNFNPLTTNVGWDVTLSHGGSNNCPLSFTGGQYSVNSVSNKGQLDTGTVTGDCLQNPTTTNDDSWSAVAT